MNDVRLAVAIPWRAGHRWREILCEYTYQHLQKIFPEFPVEFFDTADELFSRGAACNEAMRTFKDYEAVLICDADILPDRAAVMAAAAAADGHMHIPFNRYYRLELDATERILHGADPEPEKTLVTPRDYPVGGVTVMNPEAWWSIGGMDERFGAWGYHDRAFYYAARALSGVTRHEGDAIHLWHDEGGAGEEEYRYREEVQKVNVALCDEYERAQNDPVRMREIIGSAPGASL